MPLAMHAPVAPSQQPPAAQSPAAQQGCPGPPQASHLPEVSLHTSPVPVQKSASRPLPVGLPGQQSSFGPPHLSVIVPPVHEPPEQTPSAVPPHVAAGATQTFATQQAPAVRQPEAAQQAWPAPPHGATNPLSQTIDDPAFSPEARQRPALQQPPAAHVPAAQQTWPGAPHGPASARGGASVAAASLAPSSTAPSEALASAVAAASTVDPVSLSGPTSTRGASADGASALGPSPSMPPVVGEESGTAASTVT
jgi:hypothetical protein